MKNEDNVLALALEEDLVQAGPWMERVPDAGLPDVANRVRGMLLGVAIGDALGNTTESINPGERRRRHGTIRDYRPTHHADGRSVGVPSDDSQLTFWTVENLVEHARLEPRSLIEVFALRDIYGIGDATRTALQRYRRTGFDWREVGTPSAGNGGLMRIAPIVLPYLRQPSSEVWGDAIGATILTHRDAVAVASSVAWVSVLLEILSGTTNDLRTCVRHFIEVVREVMPPDLIARPRGGAWGDFEGTFVEWLERCHDAFPSNPDVAEGGALWHSGAYLMETLPSVLHVLSVHPDDPEEALVCAVNNTRDNDTVAAIVGAAVGAAYGASAFPDRWVDGLLGRTRADDDGRVFALIDGAVARFA